MEIINTRIYTGRNIYSHRACIKLTVEVGEMCDTPTKDIEGFNQRLIEVLPGFKKHKCSLGYEGGFLERLETGTYLPHVYEHIIIEMQNLLGFKNVRYGKARCINKSTYNVIFQYELEEAGILCALYGVQCINNFINGLDFNMEEALSNIEKEIANVRLGPSTKGICDEAIKRCIPVIQIGKQSILQLGYGKKQRRMEATLTDKTSCISVDIACDKELTKEILNGIGLPVPQGRCVQSEEGVINVCKEIGFPIVIKPLDGNQGKGVTVCIKNEEVAKSAYEIASKINKKVLVERYFEGRDYRVLVIDKKVVAVSLRMPPEVIGDGVHTIKELIDIENSNPLRGYDHEKPLTKILIDEVLINYLKEKDRDLNSVPDRGEKVQLRFNANLSTGGMARDCTEIIHPDNVEIIVKAAEAVGLDIAGVDVCTRDISKSIITNGGVILEVNAAPGIRMHMYPNIGKSRNVPAQIIDYLFPKEEAYSIPVISVTGTNGKTTTTRMIAHILSLKGFCVGMTSTSGVYINNRCVVKGDNTGPDSAKMVLMDKSIDVAVLETARGGILRRGLGYDLADVGVITNISEDHLGIDGVETIEDLIYVKSLVAEAVKDYGYTVLNADDTSVNILNQRVKSNIIYFSKNSDNIILKKHLTEGGRAVFLKDGFIYLGDGEVSQPIIGVKDIPSTIEGMLEYNIENAMAAAAACVGLKERIDMIAKGLKTFFPDDSQNPGRFNVYNINNFKLVVDYGHNIGGYNAVIDGLKKMSSKRIVGIIGVPGDRMDESIIELGRISGESFDYIYIKEDMDKRGRKKGEVAALLERGVIASGKAKTDYNIILNEAEALKHAMENACEGDCIVMFYEDYDITIKTINEFKRNLGVKIKGAEVI